MLFKKLLSTASWHLPTGPDGAAAHTTKPNIGTFTTRLTQTSDSPSQLHTNRRVSLWMCTTVDNFFSLYFSKDIPYIKEC
jgi:hypothetical protein